MSSRSARVILAMFAVGLPGGCASVPGPVVAYKPPAPPQGRVLVVDGAGGSPAASRSLIAVVKKTGTPLEVTPYVWSHGAGRAIADMTDLEYAQDQARCLAETILRYRAAEPDTPIHLLAYSAGTHVALEATRCLPADSLGRVVLLAPAVSAEYDLRPALAAARQGVDAFYSERDRLYLGVGTGIVGTADGERGVPAAGRVGFDPPALSGPTGGLSHRLRQHPWDRSVAWTGNDGSHSGTLRPNYLRSYVLPLLTPPDAPAAERLPVNRH